MYRRPPRPQITLSTSIASRQSRAQRRDPTESGPFECRLGGLENMRLGNAGPAVRGEPQPLRRADQPPHPGSFDDDGDRDILWRHDDGTVFTWTIENAAHVGTTDFGVMAGPYHRRLPLGLAVDGDRSAGSNDDRAGDARTPSRASPVRFGGDKAVRRRPASDAASDHCRRGPGRGLRWAHLSWAGADYCLKATPPRCHRGWYASDVTEISESRLRTRLDLTPLAFGATLSACFVKAHERS